MQPVVHVHGPQTRLFAAARGQRREQRRRVDPAAQRNAQGNVGVVRHQTGQMRGEPFGSEGGVGGNQHGHLRLEYRRAPLHYPVSENTPNEAILRERTARS